MEGCWRQRKIKFARYAGLCAGTCTLLLAASPVLREAASQMGCAASLRGHAGAVGLSLIAGLVAFLVLTALLYLSRRRRWTEREATHHLELSALRAKLDRAELFLGAETQIIVAWGGLARAPISRGIFGLPGISRIPAACMPSAPGCRQGRRKLSTTPSRGCAHGENRSAPPS